MLIPWQLDMWLLRYQALTAPHMLRVDVSGAHCHMYLVKSLQNEKYILRQGNLRMTELLLKGGIKVDPGQHGCIQKIGWNIKPNKENKYILKKRNTSTHFA